MHPKSGPWASLPSTFLLTFALLGACDCGDPMMSSDAGSMDGAIDGDVFIAPITTCEADPALIDARWRCLADDDCPCGAHCELGVCIATCRAGSECGTGERCDRFGRCRGESERALIPVPATTSVVGTARPLEAMVHTNPESGEARVVVDINLAPIDRIRVSCRDGAEIKCEDGEWGVECEYTNVMPEDDLEIEVRIPEAPADAPLVAELDVDTGSEHHTVSVERRPIPAAPATAPFQTTPFEGRYEGRARMIAAGGDVEIGSPTEVPVSVLVYGTPDAATWVVEAPSGAFSSTGSLVGSATLADPENDFSFVGDATFPVQPFHASDLGRGSDYEILAAYPNTRITIIDEPRIVRMGLVQRFDGLGPSVTPQAHWEITLTRTGDAAGSAPVVPANAEFTIQPGLNETAPTPWESAFADAFPAWSELSWEEKKHRYSYLMGERPFDACFGLDPAGMDSIFVLMGMTPGDEVDTANNSSLLERWVRTSGASRQTTRWNFFGVVAGLRVDTAPIIVSGALNPNAVPCEGEFLFDGANESNPLDRRPLDHCAELAAATGCVPSPYAGGRVQIQVTTTASYFSGPDNTELSTITFFPTHQCLLPTEPTYCAQSTACVDPRDEELPANLDSEPFAATLGALSGEANCDRSSRTAAIEVDALADLGPAMRPMSSEVFERCRATLSRLDGVAPTPMGLYGAGLVDVLDAECLDIARTLTSVRFGLEASRDTTPGADTGVDEAGAYALHLMGRWLRLHAFLASEAKERQGMASESIFAPGTPGASPDLSGVLEASLRGWDFLFHPRFAESLGRIPRELLAQPDYREYALGLTVDESDPPDPMRPASADPQRIGLPVAMLDTLARQTDFAASLIDAAVRRVDGAAVSAFERSITPRAVLARSLALWLRERAAPGAPETLPWNSRFDGADDRLSQAQVGIEESVEDQANGENPLGIDDSDLPLYFLATSADGPGGRFAAISDYLLGTGAGGTAWAPRAVSQAQAALAAGRASFIAQADRDYVVARDDRELTRWVGEVRDEYNAELRDYCGPLDESLVDDPLFNAASCALNQTRADCRIPSGFDGWREEDILGHVCLARSLDGFRNPAVQAFMDICIEGEPRDATEDADLVEFIACGGANTCLRCVSGRTPDVQVGAGDMGSLIQGVPQSLQGSIIRNAAESCRATYPTFRMNVPLPDSANRPLETPGCVSGTLGEHFLDIVAAANTVQSAQQDHAAFTQAYDIAVDGCQILEEDMAERERLRAAHSENMQRLHVGRAIADSIGIAAGAVKECTATAAGADGAITIATGGGLIAASCVAGGVEAAANIASAALTTEIDLAQIAHESTLDSLGESTEIRRCYNDARAELIGIESAALAMIQANFDAGRAQATIEQEVKDAQRIWADGHSYINEITTFEVRPAAGDLWADENVNTYVRRMVLARRATYLALRAVEFETQQSLGQRMAVYMAETPDDLEMVLDALRAAAGTRNVHGSRPSDLHVVLSLRDDILQVGNTAAHPTELGPLSPAQSLRLLLSSEDYAVYDADNRWLGQRIPFELAPLGALGFPTGGVPIYSTGDCAERLWAVNASVVGDELLSGTDTSFVRINLEKQNTFYSQWCTDAPEGMPFQTASVRPTRNLFREPGSVLDTVGADSFGTDREITGFSTARMQAFLGIDRAGLEDPTYANGETSELGARGLFGEYAIFIPAELIARERTDGAYSTGLVLDRVDDILLRLDYVSVAR